MCRRFQKLAMEPSFVPGSKFLVQCDQQNDARNQDNKRDKKMAVCENGFRSVDKSQLNLQGQISFALPNVKANPIFRCAPSACNLRLTTDGGSHVRVRVGEGQSL